VKEVTKRDLIAQFLILSTALHKATKAFELGSYARTAKLHACIEFTPNTHERLILAIEFLDRIETILCDGMTENPNVSSEAAEILAHEVSTTVEFTKALVFRFVDEHRQLPT
jgi:hypothetical protein